MTAGRPTDYKPEYARQAGILARYGATDAEIADFFGKDESTINRWKERHPEFRESLKAGKEPADDRVERSLYQRAIGYSHPGVKIMQHEGCPLEVPYTEHYPPDTTACIFWLKNRRPKEWRDKVDHNHSSDPSAPPTFTIKIDNS